MRVSHVYWEPWFNGHPPRLDLQDLAEVIPGLSGVFASDVAVMHAPSLLNSGQRAEIERLRQNSPPGQVWILESHESSVNYPDQADAGFRSLFDAEMSFRQRAEIWVPYLEASHLQDYGTARTGDREELCCAFISSGVNKSGREEYMAELARHIEIASFGRFLNNRRIVNDTGTATKLSTMKRFTYALSFENAIETDYVTEKFFDPLRTGTIPVYLGAPNIEDFSPGDDSFIDASKFPEPAELARFLLEQKPERFHAWRQRPLRQSFKAKLQRLAMPLHQRFAATAEPLIERRRRAASPKRR